MKNEKLLPTPISLRIVAVIFILSGLTAVWTMGSDLYSGVFSISTTVLSLFVGIGLLRHSPRWRTVALVLLVIGVVFIFIFGVVAIVSNAVPVTWFDLQLFGTKRRAVVTVAVVSLLLLNAWMISTLVKANVKALFQLRKA